MEKQFKMGDAYNAIAARVQNEDHRKPNLKSLVIFRDEKGRTILDLSIRCVTGGERKGLPDHQVWVEPINDKPYQRPAKSTIALRSWQYLPNGDVRFKSYNIAEDTQRATKRLQRNEQWPFDKSWNRKIPPISFAPADAWFHVSRVNWDDPADPATAFWNSLASQLPWEMSDEDVDKFYREKILPMEVGATHGGAVNTEEEQEIASGIGSPISGFDEPPM